MHQRRGTTQQWLPVQTPEEAHMLGRPCQSGELPGSSPLEIVSGSSLYVS